MASSMPDFAKMTLAQLREQCKSRGLAHDGKKAALVVRLTDSFLNEEKILNADVNVSKDSLDDELNVSVNEDDVLGPISPKKKGKIEVPKTEELQEKLSAKKTDRPAEGNSTEKEEEKPEAPVDPKQKRAERFGLPPTTEQLKQKRAERFGLTSTSSGAGDSEEEKLRKRAERFGSSSVSKTSSDDQKEVLRKRAERFGLDFKDSGSSKGSSKIGEVEKPSAEVLERRAKRFGFVNEKAEVEMKKQKRAERFGLNKA